MGDPDTYRHARDIPDDVFLAAVDQAAKSRGRAVATVWDVAAVLGGAPIEPGVFDVHDIPGVPAKVVRAKAKRLINRNVLDGCPCGCRGDFQRRTT